MTEIPLHYLMVNAKCFVVLQRQFPRSRLRKITPTVYMYTYNMCRHVDWDTVIIGYGWVYPISYL